MATYIKTLKEDNGDIVYPQTNTDAVFTSTNETLETRISKYVTAEDIARSVASFGTVTTGMIADDAITTAKIDDGAVTTAKVADAAITSQKIDWTTMGGNFSTSEVDTGYTWIDGKKIYTRVFSGTTTNTANQDMYINLWTSSGVDTLIDMGGWFKYGNNGQNPIPNLDDAGNIATVYIQNGTRNITYRFKNATAFTDRPYQIWIKYTKV